MGEDTLTKLLRIFYKYNSSVVFYIEEGKLKGFIEKHSLQEMLSSLKNVNHTVPVINAKDLDQLLDLHLRHSVTNQGIKKIPVVNARLEFVGMWSRSEVINAWESLPKIQQWSPVKVSREETYNDKQELEQQLKNNLTLPPIDKEDLEPDIDSKTSDVTISGKALMQKIEDRIAERKRREITAKYANEKPDSPPEEPGHDNEKGENLQEQTQSTEKSRAPGRNIKIQIHRNDSDNTRPKNKTIEPTEKTEKSQAIVEPVEDQKTANTTSQPQSSIEEQISESENNITDQRAIEDQKLNASAFVRQQLARGRLGLLTIEALAIPLLAVDNNAEQLFVNYDWLELEKKHGNLLEAGYLHRTVRELMADKAIAGTLSATETFELNKIVPGYTIKVRTIRNFDESEKKIPKALGYLFWIEKKFELPERKQEKENSFMFNPSTGKKNYNGKTLPQVIEEEEKRVIQWAMEQADGNQSNAAMLVGIPRQTFSYKYNKYFKKKKRK